jgi:hypothetical protein
MDLKNILDDFVINTKSEDLIMEILVNQCITASEQTYQLLFGGLETTTIKQKHQNIRDKIISAL